MLISLVDKKYIYRSTDDADIRSRNDSRKGLSPYNGQADYKIQHVADIGHDIGRGLSRSCSSQELEPLPFFFQHLGYFSWKTLGYLSLANFFGLIFFFFPRHLWFTLPTT